MSFKREDRILGTHPIWPSSICKLMLIISCVITSLTLISCYLGEFYAVEVGYLGVLVNLPYIYWVGLFFTVATVIILTCANRIGKVYWVLSVSLISLYYLIIPTMNFELPLVAASYYPFGEVKSLIDMGQLPHYENYPITSYRSWPAYHVLNAVVISLTGLSPLGAADLLNLLMNLIFLISLGFCVYFTLGNGSQNLNKALTAFILALSGTFLFFLNYVPQTLAYILYIYILALILGNRNFNATNRHSFIIVVILIAISLVITHFLTALIVLSAALISSLSDYKLDRWLPLFILFLAFWNSVAMGGVLEIGVNNFVSQISNLDDVSVSAVAAKVNTVSPYRDYLLHGVIVYLLLLFSLIMMVLFTNFKTIKGAESRKILLFGLAILPWGAFKYALTVSESGVEMLDRILLFGMPVLSLFIFKQPTIFSAENKKIFTLIVVCMLILLALFIRYPNTSFNQIQPGDLAGTEFYADLIEPNEPYHVGPPQLLWYFKSPIGYSHYLSFTPTQQEEQLNSVKFIAVSDSQRNAYLFTYGFDPTLQYVTNKNLMYDSGTFQIHRGL